MDRRKPAARARARARDARRARSTRRPAGAPGSCSSRGRRGSARRGSSPSRARRAAERGLRVLSARGGELERELPVRRRAPALRGRCSPTEARERAARRRRRGGARRLRARRDGGADGPAGDASFAALHGLYWLTVNLAAERPAAARRRRPALVRPRRRCASSPTSRAGSRALPVLLAAQPAPAEPGADRGAARASSRSDPLRTLRPARPAERGRGRRRSCAHRLGDGADPAFAEACHAATGGNPLLLQRAAEGARGRGRRSPTRRTSTLVAELGPRAVVARRAAAPRAAAGRRGAVARALAVLGDGADLGARRGARRARARPRPPRPPASSPAPRSCAPSRRSASSTRSCATPSTATSRRASASCSTSAPPGCSPTRGAPLEQRRRAAAARPRRAATRGSSSAARGGARGARAAARRTARSPTCARALAEPPAPERRPQLRSSSARPRRSRAGRRRPSTCARRTTSLADPVAARARGRAPGRALLIFTGARRRTAAADRARAPRLELPAGHDELARRARGARADRRLLRRRRMPTTGSSGSRPPRRSSPRARPGREACWPRSPRTSGRCAAAPPTACAALAWRALDGRRAAAPDNGGVLGRRRAARARARRPRRGARRVGRARSRTRTAPARCSRSRRPPLAAATTLLLPRRARRGRGGAARRARDARRSGASDAVARLPDGFLAELLRRARRPRRAPRRCSTAPACRPDLRPASSPTGARRRRVLLAEGRAEEALEHGRRVERSAPAWRRNPALRPVAVAAGARRSTGSAGSDEAVAIAAEELALARDAGARRGAVGRSLRVLGTSRATTGSRISRRPSRLLEDAPARLEHAKALAALGAALRRDRRPTEAREPLRRALELADVCGATAARRARARRAPRRPARGRARAALRGVAALTPSERRVADLAADGTDQPRHRPGAVRHAEDGRGAPLERVPQARHPLAASARRDSRGLLSLDPGQSTARPERS